MNGELIFKTNEMSENEIFFALKGYDELFVDNPTNDESEEGTYIVRLEKLDCITYRVYHCRIFNGDLQWFKLPSINLIRDNYLTEYPTIIALKGILREDNCKVDKLKGIINHLLI